MFEIHYIVFYLQRQTNGVLHRYSIIVGFPHDEFASYIK